MNSTASASPAPRTGGFHLIECLAAVAMLTAVMGTALPLIHRLTRAHQTFLLAAAEGEMLERAAAMLREDLRTCRGPLDRADPYVRDDRTFILDGKEGPIIWRAEEQRLLRIDPRESGEGRSFVVSIAVLELESLADGALLRAKIVPRAEHRLPLRPVCVTVAVEARAEEEAGKEARS